MFGCNRDRDCDFCGQSMHKGGDGEFKKCHEEERCFEKKFECREKKTIECREKRG